MISVLQPARQVTAPTTISAIVGKSALLTTLPVPAATSANAPSMIKLMPRRRGPADPMPFRPPEFQLLLFRMVTGGAYSRLARRRYIADWIEMSADPGGLTRPRLPRPPTMIMSR
jgi:hypothetical protein